MKRIQDSEVRIQNSEFIIFWILAPVFWILANSCAHGKNVEILAGQTVPNQSFAIDVSYDETLDHLVPGYRIITVAIHNQGYDSFVLSPEQDQWSIVDAKGFRHTCFAELHRSDPVVWQGLKTEIRELLAYPLVIPAGISQAIDLFVTDTTDLNRFRSLIFKSASLQRTIKVIRKL